MYFHAMSMSPPPGGRVVTRRGGGDEATALRRTAEVLSCARHPGVPELLDVRADAGAIEIEMWLPAAAPLRTLAMSLEEVAGVTATVATTVADLHDIGIAVGAIAAEGV